MYDQKKIVPVLIMPRSGAFGHKCDEFKMIRWYKCREVFHRYWAVRDRDIYICHGTNKGRAIATFMQEAEQRLGIKELSEFGPSQCPTISWGRLSPWWTTSKMKKWFLTVLLRAGAKYSLKKKDFNAALYGIEFTRSTEPAVKRFFSGYTRYTGNSNGWLAAFAYASPKTVSELLIK